MKRPAFQFYPADWRNNAKLRRCSEAARGAWVDVLCVLHDSDEYGVCRWPLADLARAACVSMKSIRELAEKDVLKGSDKGTQAYVYTPRHAGQDGDPVTLIAASESPCWFSSRFVRDEYVRTKRGMGSRFGEENQPPKTAPKETPKVGIGDGEGMRQGDGPSSSSSSTSINNPNPAPLGATGAVGELFETAANPEADFDAVPPAKPAKPKSTPKPREQNETLNALATVGGGVAAEVPKTRWSAVQKCLREIREVCPDVTHEEIQARARNYRRNHPDWTLTPEALTKHWATCGNSQAPAVPICLPEPPGWRELVAKSFPECPYAPGQPKQDAPWAKVELPHQRRIVDAIAKEGGK